MDTLRSPWDPSRAFFFQKSFMKHVSNVHFYEYKWHLLYSPWLNLSRSLRVSLSPQITLGPIQIIFFSKIVHETCFKSSFLIKDSLLGPHLEVDFEGVVKVL